VRFALGLRTHTHKERGLLKHKNHNLPGFVAFGIPLFVEGETCVATVLEVTADNVNGSKTHHQFNSIFAYRTFMSSFNGDPFLTQAIQIQILSIKGKSKDWRRRFEQAITII
jgi:hypothetical protein